MSSFVIPGDYVGKEEEFIPSFGVYSEGGELYSSIIGYVKTDAEKHNVKVFSKAKIPRMQKESTIVVGIVAELNDNIAIVDLMPIKSKSFLFVPNEVVAVLKVANVSRSFTKSLRDVLGIGDIIRAKIDSVYAHSVQLRIDEANLGVIKAYCKRCRHPLKLKGRRLVCENCGHVETRKLAKDYGQGKVM
ncbi:RNA-binding protein [Candidatus Micrarchaeota archaeon]|nr:MAG: RNA-binding protein [Candidatus Micrarchaeota archaeon]